MANVDLVMRLLAEDKASDKFKRVGDAVDRTGKKVEATSGKFARFAKKASTELTIAGAAMTALPLAAIAASTSFEKSMSGVAAVSGATAGEMDALREAAIRAGQATSFSASEAATAEAELAKAGIAVTDVINGGLDGALALAAAGQLDLGEAATIAAQAMNIFKLEGKDVTRIADTLAAGANKSAADVHQLGEAMRSGGLVAQQTGLSLEETVGALSAFADRALVGSDAGTSLKTMLMRLVPTTDKAKTAMESYNIEAFDAQGNFVGLERLAGSLQKGLKGLTAEQRSQTMTTIFGSDAVRAANVLFELGAEGVRDYTSAVTDQGAAARMAAVQMDNLSGDLETLKGSIETALIQSGSGANETLRSLVQTATNAVNTFSNLPQPVQSATVAVVGLAGGFLLLAPRVLAAKELLASFSATAAGGGAAGAAGSVGKFRGALGKVAGVVGAAGPWGIAIATGISALALFGNNSEDAARAQGAFKQALDASNGALDEQVRKSVAVEAENRGLLETARKLGISEKDVTDAILGDVAARQRIVAVTSKVVNENRAAVSTGRGATVQINEQAAAAGRLSQGMQALGVDFGDAAESARRVREAVSGVNEKMREARAIASKGITLKITPQITGRGEIIIGTGGGRQVLDVDYRANGGPVKAGRPYVVGERRPELFVPDSNGTIIPRVPAMAGGGGSAEVNVYLDGRLVQRSLVDLKNQQGGRLNF